ncbi:MAG: sigma-70 family RNA polymerase sigma factor [Acidobacteriota bacterium]
MTHLEKKESETVLAPSLSLSDEEIVKRVLRGEKELFAELLSRHKKGIFNYILRMAGHYDIAVDLTQDVFMKIYLALDKFNHNHKFSTWMFSIASNLTIDYLRKKKAPPISYESTPSGDRDCLKNRLKSGFSSPLDEMKKSELKEKIQESIIHLEPEYREVIVLRHLRGLSYEEICMVTGLPLGTVKNRIFRARQMLKEDLNSYLMPEGG